MTTPAHIPAVQARSRQTEERIVAAAIELLDTHEVAQLSVTEIARHAGVSVGGFYARFASKDALFEYLYANIFGAVVERAVQRLSVERTRDLDARQVITEFISMAVDAFREHRTVIRQISLRSRTSSDPAFRARVLDTNRTLHDLFRERLFERLDQIRHPAPRRAIDIALTSVSAAMREYVLFQDLRPQYDPIDDPVLVAELTDLFCAYLRI